MAHRLTNNTIDDLDALRSLIGEPTALVCHKQSDKLNALTRQWIEQSPFLCLATSSSSGTCDVSPRGDPRGFVRIIDDNALLVPERPGNKIADSLTNILQNPRVGLLFFVPGIGDTFRVNGRATLTTDAALLAPCSVEGKAPKLGILVDIDEAYTQCSKAFLRSDLWNPARFLERTALPTNGAIHKVLAEERSEERFDADKYDRERAERYARRDGFY